MAPNELRAGARRAYELGRVRCGLRSSPIILVAAAAAIGSGRPASLTCGLAAALLVGALALAVRGGAEGRAVRPGLLAGAVALSLPLGVRTIGHFWLGPECMLYCFPACILGGALAGAALARRASAGGGGVRFLGAALVLAGLLGAMGCSLAGAAGVIGMAAAALGAGVPVLAFARLRS